MAGFDLITKENLEKFKIELFAEVKKPSYELNKKEEQKERLKSYEVHSILNISAGTWQLCGETVQYAFQKSGGFLIKNMTRS